MADSEIADPRVSALVVNRWQLNYRYDSFFKLWYKTELEIRSPSEIMTWDLDTPFLWVMSMA